MIQWKENWYRTQTNGKITSMTIRIDLKCAYKSDGYDKHAYPCNQHTCQEVGHFYHPRKLSCISFPLRIPQSRFYHCGLVLPVGELCTSGSHSMHALVSDFFDWPCIFWTLIPVLAGISRLLSSSPEECSVTAVFIHHLLMGIWVVPILGY